MPGGNREGDTDQAIAEVSLLRGALSREWIDKGPSTWFVDLDVARPTLRLTVARPDLPRLQSAIVRLADRAEAAAPGPTYLGTRLGPPGPRLSVGRSGSQTRAPAAIEVLLSARWTRAVFPHPEPRDNLFEWAIATARHEEVAYAFEDWAAQGITGQPMVDRVVQTFEGAVQDPIEGPRFWITLAVRQCDHGYLLTSVRDRAIALMPQHAAWWDDQNYPLAATHDIYDGLRRLRRHLEAQPAD